MPAVLLPGAVEESIKRADQEYLEKHNIKGLMQELMTQVVTLQPKDPTQYLVDVLSFDNAADAVQDKHGLSAFRQRKLLQVFKGMDKSKTGTVSFREVQAHTSRFGGSSLTETELSEIFKEFDSAQDNQITLEEFLAFFARPKMDNNDFELMCSDMLDS